MSVLSFLYILVKQHSLMYHLQEQHKTYVSCFGFKSTAVGGSIKKGYRLACSKCRVSGIHY